MVYGNPNSRNGIVPILPDAKNEKWNWMVKNGTYAVADQMVSKLIDLFSISEMDFQHGNSNGRGVATENDLMDRGFLPRRCY